MTICNFKYLDKGKYYQYIFYFASSCISQVESGEGELTAGLNFACTYGRSKVAHCNPGVAYLPMYWFTR